MLDLAGIRDGDKVLEIGTGTGYSTAILCDRLGDERIFSVEYDPGLAAAAADHIHAAGHHPTLITGDGLAGHKDGAEYDAVIATCAVRHIPPAWLHQVRAGGTITTTISGWMLASGLLRLGPRRPHRNRPIRRRPDRLHARPHPRAPTPPHLPPARRPHPPHPGKPRPPGRLDDLPPPAVGRLRQPPPAGQPETRGRPRPSGHQHRHATRGPPQGPGIGRSATGPGSSTRRPKAPIRSEPLFAPRRWAQAVSPLFFPVPGRSARPSQLSCAAVSASPGPHAAGRRRRRCSRG
ncbi:methyltransferase domain-containing protein [Streptomyces sp. NPDC054833]